MHFNVTNSLCTCFALATLFDLSMKNVYGGRTYTVYSENGGSRTHTQKEEFFGFPLEGGGKRDDSLRFLQIMLFLLLLLWFSLLLLAWRWL